MKFLLTLAAALALVTAAALFQPAPAHAQAANPPQYSLLDFQHRLSIGGRLYRSFDELPGLAGSYSSDWWAGVPLAYIVTGHLNADGSVNPLPISLIGALDIGLQGKNARRIRGYVGIAVLFKGTD